jgi:flagellar basal-body rod protein FlgB
MSDLIADATVDVLRTALGRASRRSALIASNLANIDTPGYRAVDIAFSDALARASAVTLERSSANHAAAPPDAGDAGVVFEADSDRIRNDGNNVDVDQQMTLLASLQGRYQSAAELVRKRFGLIVYAVTDGRNGS